MSVADLLAGRAPIDREALGARRIRMPNEDVLSAIDAVRAEVAYHVQGSRVLGGDNWQPAEVIALFQDGLDRACPMPTCKGTRQRRTSTLCADHNPLFLQRRWKERRRGRTPTDAAIVEQMIAEARVALAVVPVTACLIGCTRPLSVPHRDRHPALRGLCKYHCAKAMGWQASLGIPMEQVVIDMIEQTKREQRPRPAHCTWPEGCEARPSRILRTTLKGQEDYCKEHRQIALSRARMPRRSDQRRARRAAQAAGPVASCGGDDVRNRLVE